MYIKETGYESVEKTQLAQDREKYRAVVNKEMNLWFSKDAGNLLGS
jgi:hypothetical protein